MNPSTSARVFTCDAAADLLGHPGATAGPCDEVLPGVWRVVLRGRGLGPGDTILRTFTWSDGQVTQRGGQGHLARALSHMQAHAREVFDPFAVQVLLEATAGAPPGFTPHAVDGRAGDQRATMQTRPFGLTLVMPNWAMPEPPSGGPGSPPRPPGGGPLGPAPGTVPPSGAMPPTVARAVLVLDSQYRGAWTVSVQRVPGGPFEPRLTVPVDPTDGAPAP